MIPTLKRPTQYFFILLLAPFIKPIILSQFEVIDTFYLAWKVCAIAYLTFGLLPRFFNKCTFREKVLFLCLLLFWLIYCTNCFLARVEFLKTTLSAMSAALCFMLITYEAKIGNGWILLKAIARLSEFFVLLQVFSMFLFRVAASTIFVFGMDNYSAFYIYPMLSLIMFYHSKHYGKLPLHSIALALLTVFSYIYTASYTAAGAGLLFLAILLLYPHWKKIPKIKGIRWIIPLLIVLLVLIIKFKVQNLLASLLTSMSKGVTLNSRTIIWDYALDLIAQKPLFGHGNFSQAQIESHILYGTTHAHNILLELLLRTGIIGTIFYLLFICGFIPAFKVGNTETKHDFILVASLVSQLILSFMDFYPSITLFYMFLAFLYSRNLFVRPEKTVRRLP